MKTPKTILLIFLMLAGLVCCKMNTTTEIKTISVSTDTTKELDPNATYDLAEFTIKGMTCEIGCAKTIEKKLSKHKGVKSAQVDFKTETAIVEYDSNKASFESLSETVTAVSETYTVENMKSISKSKLQSEKN
jgi:Cu+-exporting ATPase